VLGLGVNTEWLARRGLPVPRRWADLTHARYRGEIQMANPNSSGTAYTALATFVQLFGEDGAFRYLTLLDRNVNQYTASGSAPVRAAARGETGIGIVFLHDATTERIAGAPILEIVPEEGTGYEIGAVSVIRGARHPEVAHRFVEWALSARAQELGARARAYHWPSNRRARPPPARVSPDDARLIDFDLARYSQRRVRERLLRRWDREVRGGRS
jgi:iron(III) transport system substrate-binding protein